MIKNSGYVFFFYLGILLFIPVAPSHSAELAGNKSAILFIGDGMGPAMIAAARAYGQGAAGKLAMESFPYTAYVRTYANDGMVTDSAAAATAMATGQKTNNGIISEDATAVLGKRHGRRLVTLSEMAKKFGKATGLVSTARLTHATPAAFYAHHNHRDDEELIAEQLVENPFLPDVLLGGGRRYFQSANSIDPELKKSWGRDDGKDLVKRLQAMGFSYIWRKQEFTRLNLRKTQKLVGLFEAEHMNYEIDRHLDLAGEPSLTEMTITAIKILQQNPQGYFLMIEGGRIDHAAHNNDGKRTITETLEFDRAIAAALKLVDKSTLVLVTADHETGGLALNGYAPVTTKGDMLLGPSSEMGETIEDRPIPLITWATGPGMERFRESRESGNEFWSPSVVKLKSAAHTGVDVVLLARGPTAESVHGFIDNTEIFMILKNFLGL